MLKEALFELFDSTYRCIADVKFDKSDPVDSTIMSLYATIVEQTCSAIVLLKEGQYGGVEAIQRSVLEAYIDLINLKNDPAYLNKMLLEFYKGQIDIGEQGVKGNKWLVGMNTAEVVKRLGEWRKKYDALYATDKPLLNKLERFKLAGEEEMYRAVYKTLCDDSHNNVSALTSRHLREKSDGGFEIVIFAEPDEARADTIYDAFAGILAHANAIVHARMDSIAIGTIKEASAKLQEARDAYMKANTSST